MAETKKKRAMRMPKKDIAASEATSHLERAFCLALRSHRDQVDKNGFPYIRHVLRVMAGVTTDTERAVAALHDVVEDTDLTLINLGLHWGFSREIVEAVDLLTRRPPYAYAEYIERIAEASNRAGQLARAVKLADLRDHLDPSLPRPVDYASLKPRYEKALLRLSGHPQGTVNQ